MHVQHGALSYGANAGVLGGLGGYLLGVLIRKWRGLPSSSSFNKISQSFLKDLLPGFLSV